MAAPMPTRRPRDDRHPALERAEARARLSRRARQVCMFRAHRGGQDGRRWWSYSHGSQRCCGARCPVGASKRPSHRSAGSGRSALAVLREGTAVGNGYQGTLTFLSLHRPHSGPCAPDEPGPTIDRPSIPRRPLSERATSATSHRRLLRDPDESLVPDSRERHCACAEAKVLTVRRTTRADGDPRAATTGGDAITRTDRFEALKDSIDRHRSVVKGLDPVHSPPVEGTTYLDESRPAFPGGWVDRTPVGGGGPVPGSAGHERRTGHREHGQTAQHRHQRPRPGGAGPGPQSRDDHQGGGAERQSPAARRPPAGRSRRAARW